MGQICVFIYVLICVFRYASGYMLVYVFMYPRIFVSQWFEYSLHRAVCNAANVDNGMNIPALTSRSSLLPSTELRLYEFAVPLYVRQLCINTLICNIISKRWCIIISYKYIVLVSFCAILVAPKNKYSAPPFNSIKSWMTLYWIYILSLKTLD